MAPKPVQGSLTTDMKCPVVSGHECEV